MLLVNVFSFQQSCQSSATYVAVLNGVTNLLLYLAHRVNHKLLGICNINLTKTYILTGRTIYIERQSVVADETSVCVCLCENVMKL